MATLRSALAVLLVATACAPQGTAATDPADRLPEGEPPLCQPFPDRLVDGFLRAYNHRDLAALRDLIGAPAIHDVGGAAHGGLTDFEDVAQWARTGWRAGDRLNGVGYTAFSPTPDGFLMHVERESDALRAAGIERVAMAFEARSTGCVIDALRSRGPVTVRGAPCRFYEAFGQVGGAAREVPVGCADGSAVFARQGHVAVWAGREMLIWGGTTGAPFREFDSLEGGLRYDPAPGTWQTTAPAPLDVRWSWRAAWTGRELIAWGWLAGSGSGPAAYDPATDSWRPLPPWPLEREANGPAGLWTGRELIVWGSSQYTDRPAREGAVFDPATKSWRPTSPAPIAGREGHTAVWTGREMVVWGGSNFETDLGDGAAYDPLTDTWRTIADPPLSPRKEHIAVWTGEEMIVWGGTSVGTAQADGAAYHPETDTWRKLADAPLEPRHRLAAVWTGSRMLVWGGYDYHRPFGDGATYDPRTDQWTLLPPAPIRPRCDHSAVWTGQLMVIFGGDGGCGSVEGIAFGDGAAYEPATRSWQRLVPKA